MNDTNMAEEKVVETETTQVAPPTTESPITGDETDIKVSDDQGTSVEKSDIESTMTEEQRRAFQEMRLENKRLKEEKIVKRESPFEVFKPTTPPVSQGPVLVENFQDPVTGDTNWQAYNQAVQLREQAIIQQSRYEAQQAVREEMDEQNARTKFPDLFADPEVERDIADKWLSAKLRGENASITDIAAGVARRYGKAVSKAEKIGAEKILNEVTEKEQATVAAESRTTSSAQTQLSQEDSYEVSQRTRRGDEDAIASRLSKIPWANK